MLFSRDMLSLYCWFANQVNGAVPWAVPIFEGHHYTTYTRQQDFEKAFYESEFRCRNLRLANARLMMDAFPDDAVEEINGSFLNFSVTEDEQFTADL